MRAEDVLQRGITEMREAKRLHRRARRWRRMPNEARALALGERRVRRHAE